jgi:hypothetical protein
MPENKEIIGKRIGLQAKWGSQRSLLTAALLRIQSLPRHLNQSKGQPNDRALFAAGGFLF